MLPKTLHTLYPLDSKGSIFKQAKAAGTTFKVGRDARTGRFISRKEAEWRHKLKFYDTNYLSVRVIFRLYHKNARVFPLRLSGIQKRHHTLGNRLAMREQTC